MRGQLARREPGIVFGPLRTADLRRLRTSIARAERVAAAADELDRMVVLLADAQDVVRRGWVHGRWFAPTVATAANASHGAPPAGSNGACLVGALVVAGGGVGAVRTQLVQRTLDLLWMVLRRPGDQQVDWCPAPVVRELHVRDLTRWNDAPGRSRDQVVGLLVSAEHRAVAERDRLAAVLALGRLSA